MKRGKWENFQYFRASLLSRTRKPALSPHTPQHIIMSNTNESNSSRSFSFSSSSPPPVAEFQFQFSVSRETVLSAPPVYYYYPRASEEHVPLSSHQGTASAFSGRLLVDTNLDTSSPDTYRPPPAPIPFNVTSGATQTPPVAQEICGDKNNTSLLSTNSNSIQEPVAGDNHGTSAKSEELKESECKVQTDVPLDLAKDSEIELPKLGESLNIVEEEDACPICLEEYDEENPKLTTKCDHHFHLACILEWMERSETCPVCDQETVFNPPIE